MKSLRKLYSYFHLLSLDVVLGAIAGMLFFAHVLSLAMYIEIAIILGLTVWIIYTLDHLMDVKKTTGQPNSLRHDFHFKNEKKLQLLVGITFVLVFILLIFLPSLHFVIIPGIILAATIACSLGLIYFFGKRIAFMKEFLIATFYVLGIVLAPSTLFEKSIPASFYSLAVLYFLVAWVNLLMLSYLDKESDQEDGFDSVINWIAPKNLIKVILSLGTLGIIFSVYLLLFQKSYFNIYTIVLLLMLLIHMVYFLDEKNQKETIRRILEASFLLPFLVLFF